MANINLGFSTAAPISTHTHSPRHKHKDGEERTLQTNKPLHRLQKHTHPQRQQQRPVKKRAQQRRALPPERELRRRIVLCADAEGDERDHKSYQVA